jgi:hypothetical protein
MAWMRIGAALGQLRAGSLGGGGLNMAPQNSYSICTTRETTTAHDHNLVALCSPTPDSEQSLPLRCHSRHVLRFTAAGMQCSSAKCLGGKRPARQGTC